MHHYFVTGTDTGVGKTHFCCDLLQQWQQQGLKPHCLKPIVSGCNLQQLLPEDDLSQLHRHCQHQATEDMSYFCALEPTAPNLTSQAKNQPLHAAEIANFCRTRLPQAAPCLIEGIGGWACPINLQETMADVAIRLSLPVILVVGLRLGCLNHALLTYEQIQASGLRIAGWVANHIEPNMPYALENLDFLKGRLQVPCLAEIPFYNTGTHDHSALTAASLQLTHQPPLTADAKP